MSNYRENDIRWARIFVAVGAVILVAAIAGGLADFSQHAANVVRIETLP